MTITITLTKIDFRIRCVTYVFTSTIEKKKIRRKQIFYSLILRWEFVTTTLKWNFRTLYVMCLLLPLKRKKLKESIFFYSLILRWDFVITNYHNPC